MLGKALTVGGAFVRRTRHVFNTRAVHAAEIPAAGGIGDARSLARMYAACIGEVDGVRILDRRSSCATRRRSARAARTS